MSGRLMIYGATCYTGELATREAVRRGLGPVLAGRNGEKVGRLAAELGVQSRVFGLADHDSIAAGDMQAQRKAWSFPTGPARKSPASAVPAWPLRSSAVTARQ